MPLLEIKPSKKVKVLCSLEESTALMVDQYAAFVKASGDDIVNKALEYAFSQDKEFQKYRQGNPSVPSALRVQLPVKASKKPMRGAKSTSPALIAGD